MQFGIIVEFYSFFHHKNVRNLDEIKFYISSMSNLEIFMQKQFY